MRWHVITIGKPKLEYARLGMEEYVSRLRPFVPTALEFVKASAAQESAALLDRSKSMFRVVLDEHGEQICSRALAKKIGHWEMQGPRDYALLIGGADGHKDEVKQAGGWVWSLGKLTLQHELALVVALEQLYRAYTIKAGLPYHRD
jgi:23S rRNA (pseudouridine1915-N3)-methyltransferase